jgi:hypothetical protein
MTSNDEFKKSDQGFKKSDQGFKKSDQGFKKSDQGFKKSLFVFIFVRDESSASGARFLIVFSRFFASGARSSDDDRRRIAGGRGVQASGAMCPTSGAELLIAAS